MKNDLQQALSKKDLIDLLTLGHQSLVCQNQDDLKLLVLNLRRLFYFENAVCAQGNVLELLQDTQEPDIDVCDISYPHGYLDHYFEQKYFYTDAVFCEFITNLSPVNWLDTDRKCSFSYPASVMALDFNMVDGWTHGTLDPDTMNCSAFFFGGPVTDNSLRTSKILEYIIPFFSEAYKRVLKKSDKCPAILTKKEVAVLNWLKEGKSSWDISKILSCSKSAIEFHVTNIKKKLNSVNRTQAVVKALKQGIIDF